jgi:hypothetical protein
MCGRRCDRCVNLKSRKSQRVNCRLLICLMNFFLMMKLMSVRF